MWRFLALLCLVTIKAVDSVLTLTLREDGTDVVIDVSGSLAVGGVTIANPNAGCISNQFSRFSVISFCGGSPGSGSLDRYLITGPNDLDTPGLFPGVTFPGVAVTGPGVDVFLDGNFQDLALPDGYAGGVINQMAALRFPGSFASLNILPTMRAQWDLDGSVGPDFVELVVAASASATGDPHFVRFGHLHHDSFHGECDLLLLSSKILDVHLRTTIRRDSYSFIDKIAMRVGSHVIEADPKHMFLDGKEVDFRDNKKFPMDLGLVESPNGIGEVNMITLKKLSKKKFRITWGTGAHIEFRAVGIYMGVSVDGGPLDFGDATGMMGHFGTGEMLDRKGNPMEDMDEFGMEWQIKEEDPILFLEKRAPQWPEEKCHMPTATGRRNLRENTKLGDEAEKACAGVIDFEMCVNDIMLTGDIELAEFF